MKEKLEKKGILYRWSQESSRWYEEAYLYSDYHKILADKICAAVPADAACCEIACGNGSLARAVAPKIGHYTANDIDPNAMEWLRNKVAEESLDNLEVVEGNWKDVLADRKFDAVIFSFFDAVLKDWDLLKNIASKKVLIIVPRERKNIMTNRFNKGKHFPESYERLIEYFEENDISYEAEPLDLEFGQPFYSKTDALEYIEYYYQLTGTEAEEFMEEKFEKTDFGWYFPKLKKIGFIAADVR